MAGFQLQAQEVQKLKGQIEVDTLNAPVHIINLSQKKGTLNNKNGSFEIAVREGDTLMISSVQFKREKIKITKEILRKSPFKIKLESEINELETVKLHKLTGNLKRDIAGIEVVEQPSFQPPAIDYLKSGSVKNDAFAANQAQMAPTGIDFIAIGKYVFGNKGLGIIKTAKNNPQNNFTKAKVINKLRKRFDDDFFTGHLSLELKQTNNFIAFAYDKGLTEKLLQEKNALELIAFLERTVKVYRQEQE